MLGKSSVEKPSYEDPSSLEKLREVKYQKWLQNKALRDKAFEYLSQLDRSRSSEEESLIELGITLGAIERQMSGNSSPDSSTEKNRRTLKSAWVTLVKENHTFSMLTLTKTDLASISDAVKEFLFSPADLVASSGASAEEISRASREKNVLPSLKYFFPAVPKPGEKPRPLTPDQKAQNVIYSREVSALWKRAQSTLETRIVEKIAETMRGDNESSEKEAKSKADDDRHGGNSRNSSLELNENNARAARIIEARVLNELGLKRLRQWLEDDEDKKATEESETLAERLRQAKISHEQFVKKKDSLRIRMPDNIDLHKPAAMSYGREMSGVRANHKGTTTTVEMMAGSGLKFVHATSKGRRGVEGDLEKSRQLLLKQGFVDRNNFDSDARRDYQLELANNAVNIEKVEQEEKIREANAKAYEDWIDLKSQRDSALRCLGLISKPTLPQDDLSDLYYTPRNRRSIGTSSTAKVAPGVTDLTRSVASLGGTRNTIAMTGSLTSTALGPSTLVISDPSHREILDNVIETGKALKRVDRTLFNDWAKWADGIINLTTANVLWDFFSPQSCDVHSPASSAVRDSFQKLLRPGVDYKEAFLDYAQKHVFRRREEMWKDKVEYLHVDDSDRRDLDKELAKLKEEWLRDVSLTREQTTNLLRTLGIVLKDSETRALMDGFDVNGDGVVTLKEFVDFCGPRRTRNGGVAMLLSQRCCWLTTCRVTGMPNGYSVSDASRRALRAEEDTKRASANVSTKKNSDDYEDDFEGTAGTGAVAAAMKIRRLANGEKRLCVELVDRRRREDLLRRLGLIGQSKKSGKFRDAKGGPSESKGGESEEETYEDDHETFSDDDGAAGSKSARSSSDKRSLCEFCTWTSAQRKIGLRYLMSATTEAREEVTLRDMMSRGTPPLAPKLWVDWERSRIDGDYSDGSDVSDGEDGPQQNTDKSKLYLKWSAANPEDLVSFFSIEYGGVVTLAAQKSNSASASSNTEGKYVEIYRDPPDAEVGTRLTLSYTLSKLAPGTSYRIRIRAFNGFGPGEYSYRVFTTRPVAPNPPSVVKLTSDSVSLRWIFSEVYKHRLEMLRRVFRFADSDNSGSVSRDELAAVFDFVSSASSHDIPKSSGLTPALVAEMTELRTFLEKVAASRGVDLKQGSGALFDAIEGDDDNAVSWDEFQSFLVAAGWATSTDIGTTGTVDLRNSTTSLKSTRTASNTAGGLSVASSLTYVVERCDNEWDDRWTEVLRTSAGTGTVSRLPAGASFRFRVYAVNIDDLRGPPSDPVLVHTLVETPLAPVVATLHSASTKKAITATTLTLAWRRRETSTSTRDASFVAKMIGDWTHTHAADEGVSAAAVFARYDRDGTGDMDASEVASLLTDLGVDVTPERLASSFASMDADGNGVVTYDEFARWWRGDSVVYVLKRSEAIPATAATDIAATSNGSTVDRRQRPISASFAEGGTVTTRSISRGRLTTATTASVTRSNANATGTTAALAPRQAAVPIVVYRDTKTRTEVRGLTPNALYHFRLRLVGARSNSALSPPLAVMTAPLSPTQPALIELGATNVRLKWYPGAHGAFKFVLHIRPSTTLSSSASGTGRRTVAPLAGTAVGDGWVAVYSGYDGVYSATSLASEATYEARVLSLNAHGTASDPSPVLRFTTLSRADVAANAFTQKLARQQFTTECMGDICVGDTILFSERLFLRDSGNANTTSSTPRAPSRNDIAAHRTANKSAIATMGSLAGATLNGGALNRSIASISVAGNDDATISGGPEGGIFVGERTIAAIVYKDNYRTVRPALLANGITPADNREFGGVRRLWLEVLWQHTTSSGKKFELRPGDVLERMQAHVEQFLVYRSLWNDEDKRRSLVEEWEMLKDCFHSPDGSSGSPP